jgi:hypothetical protein
MRLRRQDPPPPAAPEPTERTLRALERIGIPRTPPADARTRECGDER